MPKAKSIVKAKAPPKGIANGKDLTNRSEVITIAEAANYLRVSEMDVLHIVKEQGLPARKIGDQWRFFLPAIQRWLERGRLETGKSVLLEMAGQFKEDPFLDDILAEAYRARGRPMLEEDK